MWRENSVAHSLEYTVMYLVALLFIFFYILIGYIFVMINKEKKS